MEEDYIRVGRAEAPDEFMEFPLENDGTITLSTIKSHFPNAIGLKYRAESGMWRGLRAVDNVFDAPRTGWTDEVYCITTSQQKNKGQIVPIKQPDASVTEDLVVLGLPFSTTDEELKLCFECFGELAYAQVKLDRETGKSRGFGFIRFKTEEGVNAALEKEQYIDGRRIEVKRKKESPMKLFVGRLPSGTTKEDLHDFFSTYGDVTDTYVPSPFRGFGFVTFASSIVGSNVRNTEHFFNGVRLNVSKGEESKSFNKKKAEKDHGSSLDVDILDKALQKLKIEQNDRAAELKSKLYGWFASILLDAHP